LDSWALDDAIRHRMLRGLGGSRPTSWDGCHTHPRQVMTSIIWCWWIMGWWNHHHMWFSTRLVSSKFTILATGEWILEMYEDGAQMVVRCCHSWECWWHVSNT
jgi:hypothetical protein